MNTYFLCNSPRLLGFSISQYGTEVRNVFGKQFKCVNIMLDPTYDIR